ncbi:MAG: DUF1646 domain-containing protein [Methanomicrobiales archaeon]|nr:DUF1646 domain-containing protein [Methanomicrobiales archaeon]
MVDAIIANTALVLIFLTVLILPFRVRIVEENLELFLFACGAAALTVSGFISLPGEVTGWRLQIVAEALTSPLRITEVLGIPVGIVQIVLVVGLLIYVWHARVQGMIRWFADRLSVKVTVFFLIVGLGLLSSIISAIIAAIILVEVICTLPLTRQSQVETTVIACFSIGLGAALTPLGEPLSTIAITKLAGPPYYAGFDFFIGMLGSLILPGILVFGVIGVVKVGRNAGPQVAACETYPETLREVVIRAAKVYIFIMALVFLGEGFKPLILEYIINVPAEALYWVNMASAILDNATLTAAEIGPLLSELQIKSALMGLLVSGGMLIPGNIPNIIAAAKLRITSNEWAVIGVPLGLIGMLVYFGVLFLPQYVL